MILNIKYMFTLGCKKEVSKILTNTGLLNFTIMLGKVEITEYVSDLQKVAIIRDLNELGLELIESPNEILVENIKCLLIEMIHFKDELPAEKVSVYLSQKLSFSYKYLALVFSRSQGCSIEQYIISNKIEKVKELIGYNQLNLTEIAWKLHYSSVAHLSFQFKKVTGYTPSHYRTSKKNERIELELV